MTLALKGIRVLDLTDSVAGPLTTRLLASCGAEVIKVESRRHLISRRFGPWGLKDSSPIPPVPEEDLDFSEIDLNLLIGPSFAQLNANKLSMTLNLSKPEARELFKKLVKVSDIVIDNYGFGVMPGWGLDYPNLKQVKEDIIVVSVPSLGKGPHEDWVSWGMNIMSYSGLAYFWGHPETPETDRVAGKQYSDYVSGTKAANAILAALFYRARTGKGQHIEVPQYESAVSVLGTLYLDYFVNNRVATPRGNRHPNFAPYNCYQCRGDDCWCVIAVFNEEEWRQFCQALGNPPWTEDPKFQDMETRLKNVGELDQNIEGWTRRHSPHQVMRILQLFGVAAGAVQNCEDLYYDLQLRDRKFMEEQDIPRLGSITFPGIPPRLSAAREETTLRTSVLGEHNDYVYQQLLGLSQEEISRLVEAEIIF